jgi:thiol:disulfide interchange protein
MLRHAAFAAFLVLVPSTLRAQTPAPAPAPKPAAKQVEAPVYDESADAKADIAAALARAKRDNKRVLLQWGANWCGWCRLLHRLATTDKDVKKELLYEYEVVHVDIGRFEKNADLAEKYAAKISEGVPYLTVLDADGKVLANQETGALELPDKTKPGHDPAKVLAFLAKNQAPALEAQAQFDAALARAKAENKRVFMHFGAPWCGWCHELENWMATPSVAAILARDYVDLKIDVDRMKGAADVQKRFPASASSGIPWFAVLDGDGKTLADSGAGNDNIGFPSTDEEIARFVALLDKSRQKLAPEDLAAIQKSLVAWREKSKS